jgi:hypothetical protein
MFCSVTATHKIAKKAEWQSSLDLIVFVQMNMVVSALVHIVRAKHSFTILKGSLIFIEKKEGFPNVFAEKAKFIIIVNGRSSLFFV